MNENNNEELLRERLRSLRLESGDMVEIEAEDAGRYALRMRPEFAALVAQMRATMGPETLKPHGILFLNELACLSVSVYRDAQKTIGDGLTAESLIGVDDMGFVIGAVGELLHGAARAALSAYEGERGRDDGDTLREYEAGQRAGVRWVEAFRKAQEKGSIVQIAGGLNFQADRDQKLTVDDLALLLRKRDGAVS